MSQIMSNTVSAGNDPVPHDKSASDVSKMAELLSQMLKPIRINKQPFGKEI